MSGGAPAPAGRVRIKGKKASVFRFFVISVAYTVVWIVITSELGFYSKLYGPQVLLQLNIAYYLPSIPVLIVLNQIEKVLDDQFGTTSSMFLRLMVGLLGCALISAFFPFMSSRLMYLLWAAVALGATSAVAFSTSYQLVAWFRSADTIALGLGCVGSGPIALLIQLGLHIGSTPKRWQWIALFEVAAAFVVAGLVAAVSLFWQYWPILSGKQTDLEGRLPLLADAPERDLDEEEQSQMLLLTPTRIIALADPYELPWPTTLDMLVPNLQEQLHSGRALRRAASAESDLSFAGWRTTKTSSSRTMNRSHTSTSLGKRSAAVPAPTAVPAWRAAQPNEAAVIEESSDQPGSYSSYSAPTRLKPGVLDDDEEADDAATTSTPKAAAAGSKHLSSTAGSSGQGGLLGSPRAQGQACSSKPQEPRSGDSGSRCSSPSWSASRPSSTAGSPSSQQHAAHRSRDNASDAMGSYGSQPSQDGSSSASPGYKQFKQQQQRSRLATHAGKQDHATGSRAGDGVAVRSPFGGRAGGLHAAPGGDVRQSPRGGLDGQGRGLQHKPATAETESLLLVTWRVAKSTWTVLVGALVASTLLNCIFPFFTYVPSSGMLGELLPQVLFYTRLFADMAGRLAPRRKALALTRPGLLVVMAGALLALGVVFFVYLRAPPAMQYDSLSIAVVALLWMGGGYINTNSYILAPSLVEAKHVTRASSLMALTHQVAHIFGLLAAVMLALWMYGDISGDL